MRDITDLVQQATSRHGLLTQADLRESGVTRSQVETFIRRGVVVRCRPGVVRLAGWPETWEQRVLAAVLSIGGVASHRAALRLWGLQRRFDGIELTVAASRRCTLPDMLVHRSRTLTDADIAVEGGVPVTTVGRTLFDVASVLPGRVLGGLVDHVVAVGLVDVADLRQLQERIGGRRCNGHARLASAIDAAAFTADVESGPELALLRLLRDGGLPTPATQYRLSVGGRRYRIDLAYPALRVAIEYDGFAAHSGHDRFEDDRVRQNDLVGAGWTVLRFTARDLRERPEELVHRVRRALAHG